MPPNKNRSVINNNFSSSAALDKIVILFKDKDPTKGITLQQNNLKLIEITESMFNLLPTISIVFKDAGRFFYEYHIQSGDAIYVTISSSGNKNAKPILDTKFIVQSIHMRPDASSETAEFEIMGIFAAESYLNDVFTYPNSNSVLNGNYIKKQSSTVISEIAKEIGMKTTTEDTDYSDFSYWLCCNETRSQFLDRIVSHAWVNENDAPILYADKYGVLHYTTVKKLAEGPRCASIKDFKTALGKRQMANDSTLLTNGIDIINASGPILNQGGYVIKQAVYDPYNTQKITPPANSENKDLEQFVSKSVFEIPKTRSDSKDPLLSFKQSEFKHNESFIKDGITSKDLSNLDVCSKYTYGGTKFSELHDHYEIAPTHNEMIRRSFFLNFIKLTLDTNRQGRLYTSGKKRPELGEKYYVDFSGNRINKIYSGDYIINKITHVYVPNCSYTQAIFLSSDCYYGVNK